MTYDELYSHFFEDELEIRFALKTVISDEKVIAEAIKHYQLGRAQDLAYAERMLSNGAAFNTVDKAIKSNIKKRTASKPQWNCKLRNALKKSKSLPDKQYRYEAHHIVAKGAQRARAAAEVLLALGIDIDDPENGVFLPQDNESRNKGALPNAYVHGRIHTKAYYANINYQVVSAYENGADSEEMKSLLKDIGDDLQKGTYPIYQYLPGSEVYA